MNVMLRSFILTVLLVALGAPSALALYPPHDASNGISCANCHYAGASINSIGFTNVCHSCHKPGGMAQLQPFSPVDASNIYQNVTSKRVGTLMNTSHNWAGALVEPRAGAVAPANPLMSYAPLVGLSCERCHKIHNPIQSATNSAPFLRTLNDRDQMCLDCHSPRNTVNQATGSHPVTMTYTTAIKKFARYTTKYNPSPVNANPANTTSALKLIGGQVLCSTCHGIHFTDSNSATFDNHSASLLGRLKPSDGYLLRTDMRGATPNAVNICTNCHKGYTAHNGKSQNVQCADCHAGHVDEADGTTANVWLVRRYMTYSTALTGKVENRKLLIPSLFQSMATKNYRDANGTGVCQSCHSLPTTVAEHSQAVVNCNDCHTHAAAWSPAGGGGCTSCHGQPPSENVAGGPNGYAAGYTGPSEALTPHASHVTTLGYVCNDCHNGAIHKSGFQQVFITPIGMAVSNGATPVYNAGTVRTCATTYCHSNGAVAGRVSGAPVYITPAWANGKGTIIGAGGECNACHGGSVAPLMATGSHTAHVSAYSLGCKECHINTTTNGTSLVAGGGHLNGTGYQNGVDVKFDTAGKNAGGAYNSTVGNLGCTATYCHSNGRGGVPKQVAQWGGTMPADCTGCHGGNATLATFKIISTGKHAAHINNVSVLGAGNNFGCAACHATTVSADTTLLTDKSHHVNGLKDYTGAKTGRIIAAGQCQNSYCHSTGQKVTVFRSMTGSKLWTGSATLGCNGCHGSGAVAFTSVAGEPNYAASNSHKKHVGDAGMTNSTGCALCHARTVDASAPNKLRNYSSAHLKELVAGRKIDVDFAASIGGSYNYSSSSCSATKCHGTASPPVWGGATLACTSCHGATFQTFSSATRKGAHAQHWETNNAASYTAAAGNSGTTTQYQFACASCHNPVSAKHVNLTNARSSVGVAEVFFGYTAAGKNPTYNYGSTVAGTDSGAFTWTNGGGTSCNTTYCHSNGAGGNGNVAVSWAITATNGCTACHGDATTAGRLLTTGLHQKHVNNAPLGGKFGCVDCHVKTVSSNTVLSDKTRHVNKMKDYSGAKAGRLSGVNCATVYCHSSGQATPTFRTVAAWTSTTTYGCNGCHGADTTGPAGVFSSKFGEPNYNSYTTAGSMNFRNSHAKHVAAATDCQTCHVVTTRTGFSILSTSTVHIDRARNVAFNTANPNVATATYNSTLKTCSNVVCHSNTAVKWGSTLDCTSCHGYPPSVNVAGGPNGFAGAYGTTTGVSEATTAHVSHATTFAYACAECHNGATHQNGNYQQVYLNTVGYMAANNGATPTYSAAARTCATTYCHSNGAVTGRVSGAPVYMTASWVNSKGTITGTTGECYACHGGSVTAPVGQRMATGSHAAHISTYSLGCKECHINTTTNGTTLVAGGAHLNGTGYLNGVDVKFNTAGGNASGVYNSTVGNLGCTATYCHSNGRGGAPKQVAQWSGTMPSDCTGCHGGNATLATFKIISTGKHAAHINNTAILGLGNNFGCVTCHATTVSADTTLLTDKSHHVNGLKDYTGARSGRLVAAGQCQNTYCHSSGQTTPVYRNMTGSKLWTGSATLGCNGCHGYGPGAFVSIAGEPNYASGTAGSATANSHKKHFGDAGLTNSTGCALCHDHTVDRDVPGKLKNYTTQHIDGNRDVIFSATVGGVYNAGTRSCSSTKCHGTASPPVWGGATLACTSCHGATFQTFSSAAKKGAHAQHWETNNVASFSAAPGNGGTTTQYQFACSSCHNPPSATHANLTNARSSVGVAEIFFGYTSAGRNPAYTYGATVAGTDSGAFTWTNGGSTSCNTTYCHSNGAGSTGNVAVSWAITATNGCTACHGDATTAGRLLATGAHQKHVNNAAYLGTNFGCVDCHAKTVSNNTTLADKRLHVDKFVQYSGLRAGKQLNFNEVTGVCSGIYCHSDGKGTTVATPSWTAAAAPLTCNACHANTSLSHPKHVTTNGITCDKCHSNTAASNTALKAGTTTHINGTYNINGTDVKFATFSSAWKATYAATGKTCSTVYCHSDGHGGYQTVTWGATLNCNSCHPFAALSAGHAKHIDVTQTAVFYNYTANRSSGDEGLSTAAYRFGCSTCHPMDEATYHGNGTIDVTLRPATGAGSLKNKNVNITTDGINVAGSHVFKTGNILTCDNVYCHTNGYAASTNWSNVTPAWTGTFANADRCANCHGNSPSVGIAGSPAHAAHVVGIHSDDIYSGTTGKLTAGTGGTGGTTTAVSHGSSAQATTINCNICHNTTVTYARNDRNPSCSTTGCHPTPTNLAQINNRALHVNGSVDLSFWTGGNLKSKAQLRPGAFSDYTAAGGFWTRTTYKAGAGSFDTAKSVLNNTMFSGGNCANVACHNGRTVNWTTDVGKAKDCTICHSRL